MIAPFKVKYHGRSKKYYNITSTDKYGRIIEYTGRDVKNMLTNQKFDLDRIKECGIINLMIDYNLNWEAVYNIVKESIEDD